MSNAKHAPKRKRGAKAVPVLGAAGLLSLAGGASAATSTAPVADLPAQTTAPNHEIVLGEEELSDVSLSTFYVFDKESAKSQLGDIGHDAPRFVAREQVGRCPPAGLLALIRSDPLAHQCGLAPRN